MNERKKLEMEKDRKREIISEYKQRKTKGGICMITNKANGRYMLKAEVDMDSFRNRFNFSMRMGSCLHPKMQRDFDQYGAEVFGLEFLEETEKKEEESQMGFRDRLKRMEESWAERFDREKAY